MTAGARVTLPVADDMAMHQDLIFDLELIRRYDVQGPRYTSYPTAVQFTDEFGAEAYQRWATHTNTLDKGRPLSLYFHLPFCAKVCFYCACNKIITANRKRAAPYLEHLYREIKMQGALFDHGRPVEQLHWGGGTPTFISHAQMRQLMQVTADHFQLLGDDSGEYSIEVDPREADAETVAVLRDLGFNRLSLGVQDFNPGVQEAVNRIQSEAETLVVIEAAREAGFKSISIDLIYGLPLQTAASFIETLDKVIALRPDRLSVFNYAHLPEMFKTQRQINVAQLPAPDEKLRILEMSIEHLRSAGYVYIGMDHFALPDDELARAQREGSLYRNFQGYSTHADCDLVAMGITAISKVGDTYSQNFKDIETYFARLEAGEWPILRGFELSADDRLRRDVITRLICDFEVDCKALEQAHTIDFDEYFAEELRELEVLQKDDLVSLQPSFIKVQPAGRLLIRNICMVFDRYLRGKSGQRFSKVI